MGDRGNSSADVIHQIPIVREESLPEVHNQRLSLRDAWSQNYARPTSAHFFDPDFTLNKDDTLKAENGMQDPQDDEEETRKDPSIFLMISLYLSVFLAALDITIITTALPTISEHLGTNGTGFTWIGSAYLLAGAASEPIWAKTSDIFGRKPIMIIANAVFLGGSVLCALSKHVIVLIAGRVVQGLGSGGLLVLPSILIADLFSQRRRGTYYGLLGMVWAVANASGPFLGGMFAEKLDWRWCFWVNIPLDSLALFLTAIFLNVHTPHTPILEGLAAIDWLGSITVLGGTVMVLVGLEFGGLTYSWGSAPVVSLISFGVLTWVAFFAIESRIPKYPLIPLRLFKTVSNCALLVINFSHGFVFIAGSYFLPVYFQAVLGAKPLLSGMYLFPFVITLSLSAVATGFIINKTGSYMPLITVGMLLMTLGFALFIDLPSQMSWGRMIIYQVIAGLGVGPNFQSPMLAIQTTVKPHDIAASISMFGFVKQLANAISVVVGSVLLQNQLSTHRQQLLEAGIETRVVNLMTGGSAVSSTMEIHHLPPHQRAVAQQSFASALQKMWIMYACVGIVGLGVTDFVRRRALSDEHVETKTGLEAQERHRKEMKERRAIERAAKRGEVVLSDLNESGIQRPVAFSGKSAEILGVSSRKNPTTPPDGNEPNSWPLANGSTGRDLASASRQHRDVDTSQVLDGFVKPYYLPPKYEGAIRAARKRAGSRAGSLATSEWYDEKKDPGLADRHGEGNDLFLPRSADGIEEKDELVRIEEAVLGDSSSAESYEKSLDDGLVAPEPKDQSSKP